MALEYSWLMPIAIFVLAALAVIAWHLAKGQRKTAVTDNLSRDAQKAVGILRKAGGRMRQKALQAKMKLSGPKFNKLLREMEELEAIRRVPGGRENTVELLV